MIRIDPKILTATGAKVLPCYSRAPSSNQVPAYQADQRPLIVWGGMGAYGRLYVAMWSCGKEHEIINLSGREDGLQ